MDPTTKTPSSGTRPTDGSADSTSALVVSQLFPPESMAGAHRWEMLLRNGSDDLDPHVVCPHPSVPVGEFERRYDLWSSDRVAGVPVTRLFTYQPTEDRTNVERLLNHGIFAVLAAAYVLVHGRKFDVTVIQVGPHTTLLPGLAALALGRGLVVDVYDRWLDNAVDFGFTTESSPAYRLLRWMERIAIESCDHLLVITSTMAETYRSRYDIDDSEIAVVPFGVDEDRFSPDPETGERRRIIYTGKLGEGQAFEPFLRGFQRLDADCELVIYGFGERREELETLVARLGIAGRVELNGPVPRAEIPELVASSSISLVPLETDRTLEYARPTKLLEAMAVGTPFVASAVGEIDAVARRSGAGIAVPNDPAAIAAALNDLLSDPDRRRSMGRRGVEFIDDNHRWDELATVTEDVLTTVASDRPGSPRPSWRERVRRLVSMVLPGFR